MVNLNFVLATSMPAAVMAGTMGDMPVLGACGARQPSHAELNYRYPAGFKGQPVKREAIPATNSTKIELPIVFHMCCSGGKCPATEDQLNKQIAATNEHLANSFSNLRYVRRRPRANMVQGRCDDISIQGDDEGPPSGSGGGPRGPRPPVMPPMNPNGAPNGGGTGGLATKGIRARQVLGQGSGLGGLGTGTRGLGTGLGGQGTGRGVPGTGPGIPGTGPGIPGTGPATPGTGPATPGTGAPNGAGAPGGSPALPRWMETIRQNRIGGKETVQVLIVKKQQGNPQGTVKGICNIPVPKEKFNIDNDGCAIDASSLPQPTDNSFAGRVKRLLGRATVTGDTDTRILTHELGHNGGLPHTFNDGMGSDKLNKRQALPQQKDTCANNDHFSDTEPQAGPTKNCPDEDGDRPGRPSSGVKEELTAQDGNGTKVDAGTGEQVGGCVRGANSHNIMDYSTCKKKGYTPQQVKHIEGVARFRLGLSDRIPEYPVAVTYETGQREKPANGKDAGRPGNGDPRGPPSSSFPGRPPLTPNDGTGGPNGAGPNSDPSNNDPSVLNPTPLNPGANDPSMRNPTSLNSGANDPLADGSSSGGSSLANPLNGDLSPDMREVLGGGSSIPQSGSSAVSPQGGVQAGRRVKQNLGI